MNTLTNDLHFLFVNRITFFQVILILLVCFISAYVAGAALRRLQISKNNTYSWKNVFGHAAYRPVQILIWLIGLSFALDIVRTHFPGIHLLHIAPNLREIVIVTILTWFLLRFVRHIKIYFSSKHKKNDPNLLVDLTTINTITQIANVLIVGIAILTLLPIFHINISGLLAFGGLGGLALSLAAKEVLSNLLGGLMLHWDRPFSIGDWICLPERKGELRIEGRVERIGWRMTVIRTPEHRVVYIPNHLLMSLAVENGFRLDKQRLTSHVIVRYSTQEQVSTLAPLIVQDMQSMLSQHPDIDAHHHPVIAYVSEFGESSFTIVVKVFTKTENAVKFQMIRQDLLLQLFNIVSRHGLECTQI